MPFPLNISHHFEDFFQQTFHVKLHTENLLQFLLDDNYNIDVLKKR